MKKVLFKVLLWLAILITIGVLCIYDAPIWAFLLIFGVVIALWAVVIVGFDKEFNEYMYGEEYEEPTQSEVFPESQYSKDFEECYGIVSSEYEETIAQSDRIIEVLNTSEQTKFIV